MKKLLNNITDQFNTVTQKYSNNPYYRLMRLDKPIGIYLTLLPTLWTLFMGATSLWVALIFLPVFVIGATLARGAGCVINDIMDAEYDKKVARTKNRPLASDEITKKQATRFLIAILLLCLSIAIFLPKAAIYTALVAVVMMSVYPLFKRYTDYPQLFLGFAFNLGVLIAGFTVSNNPTLCLLIYIAAVCWTIGYDTIYAHQDREDDEKIGVKSLAIRLGDDTRKIVEKLYLISACSLGLAALTSFMNWGFYIFFALALYEMHWQVTTLNINDKENCAKRFNSNAFVGFLILIGAIVGKF